MNFDIFIASKPLQIVNCINIISGREKILVVCRSFADADNFVKKLQKCHFFNKIIIVDNIIDAFKFSYRNRKLFSHLYIPSDYGIRIGFWLRLLKKKEIWIYEEGLGNYEPDFAVRNRISRYFHVCLTKCKDIDMFFGASPHVKGIVIYQKELFLKKFPLFNKPILKFNNNFLDIIRTPEILELFNYSDYEQLRDKEVLLYLTTWTVSENINYYLRKYHNIYKIIKPHPHIKESIVYSGFDEVVDGQILAEVVISQLARIVSKLIILHENSTSILYFQDVNNIEIYDIGISKLRK